MLIMWILCIGGVVRAGDMLSLENLRCAVRGSADATASEHSIAFNWSRNKSCCPPLWTEEFRRVFTVVGGVYCGCSFSV